MAATLTPEARGLCEKYIGQLLDEWEVSLEWRHTIAKGGTVKARKVVRLRRRLVRTLRDTCWQDNLRRAENVLIDYAEPGIPWLPLSTMNIADLLNVTHGAVVAALQRTAKTVDTAST